MAKKNKELHLRIDAKSYELAQKNANVRAGGNLSSYIRLLLLEQSPRTDPELVRATNELKKEIRKIGVNINQIARAQNGGHYLQEDKQNLFNNQDEIMKLIKKYISELQN